MVGRPTPSSDNAPFSTDVMAGLTHHMVADCNDIGEVEAAVAPTRPDVLVLGGWQHQGISELAVHRDRLGAQSVVMAMDNPQRFTGHGLLVSTRHRRYLRYVDAVWVPGERSRQLAAEIRTRSGLVFTGLYGVDDRFRTTPAAIESGSVADLGTGVGIDAVAHASDTNFASDPASAAEFGSTSVSSPEFTSASPLPPGAAQASDTETAQASDTGIAQTSDTADTEPPPHPRSFLFTGQYVQRKGLDLLIEAYRSYRATAEDPWSLTCVGTGEMASDLVGEPGITDLGFVQPADQPAIVASHGAVVVPSRVDPWPLVVVEGALGGRPLIVTDACGSAVELVRDGFNGLVIPVGSAAALGEALHVIAAHEAELATWGQRSVALAAPYTATEWASRVLVLFGRLRHSVT